MWRNINFNIIIIIIIIIIIWKVPQTMKCPNKKGTCTYTYTYTYTYICTNDSLQQVSHRPINSNMDICKYFSVSLFWQSMLSFPNPLVIISFTAWFSNLSYLTLHIRKVYAFTSWIICVTCTTHLIFLMWKPWKYFPKSKNY